MISEKKKLPALVQAKLFILEVHSEDSVQWVEKATGIPSFVREEGGYKFRFIGETDDKNDRTFNYEITVSDNLSFDRSQSKVITWTLIKENIQMALSFRDQAGANNFWALVDQYLRKEAIHVQANSTTDMFLLEYKIPEPGKDTLQQILRELQDIPLPERRQRINSIFIMKRDLFPNLRNLFNKLENQYKSSNSSISANSRQLLIVMFEIIKLVINYSDMELLSTLVSQQYWSFTLGCLQYDPPFLQCKLKHRQFNFQKSRYIQVIPIKNKERTKQIHFIQRLEYIKDCALNHHLDQSGMRIISVIIFSHYRQILNSIFNVKDQQYLNQLFHLLRLQDIRAYKLLLQICRTARSLDLLFTGTKQTERDLVFSMLAQKQIYQILMINLKQLQALKPGEDLAKNKFASINKSRIKNIGQLQQITQISLQIIGNSLEVQAKFFKNYCSSQKQKVLRYPIILFLLKSLSSQFNRLLYARVVEQLVRNEQIHEITPLVQQLYLKQFLEKQQLDSVYLKILHKLCDTLSESFRQKLTEIIKKLIFSLNLKNKIPFSFKQRKILALQCLRKIAYLYAPLQQQKNKLIKVLQQLRKEIVAFLQISKGNNNLQLSILLQTLLNLKRAGGTQSLMSNLRLDFLQHGQQRWAQRMIKYLDDMVSQQINQAPQLKRQRTSLNLGQQIFDGLPEKKPHNRT